MDSRDFEAFYNSLIDDEQRDIVPHIKDSKLSKERKRILDNLYLKEVCRFIFEEGRFEFGTGVAEALVQYLAKGELRLCNMEQWLYPTAKKLNEQWLYAHLIQDPKVDRNFKQTAFSAFFGDIVSRLGEQHLNGVTSTMMDFNVMLHIFIMKTRACKNNTDVWNGIDLSECRTRSPYTVGVFNLFRYHYRQQVANDVSAFISMTLSALSEFESGMENTNSLGMLDHVALDVLGQSYRFDNGYNTVEPDVEELDKISRKILRIYERRTNTRVSGIQTDPSLTVYLCSADSFQYLVAKHLAMYFDVAFFEVYNLLKDITSWSDEEKLATKLARITAKFGKDQEYERRLDVARRAIVLSKEQRKVGIVDEDFYKMCLQYYVPSMKFVIYNWNVNAFVDVASEVEIDFKKVLEREGEDFENYLVQLYHAGQNINILRRLLEKDKKFLRVTVKNVPFKYGSQVENILQRETRSVNSKYGDKFCYLYTLDNEEALAIAKYNLKHGGNTERDAYLEKYKNSGIRSNGTWKNNKKKKRKPIYRYPSGEFHKFIDYKRRKSDWKTLKKGSKVMGRHKIIKGLEILQSYFELKRRIEDEENRD